MKRKSNSIPDVSDEEEYKDTLPVSDNPQMKGVDSIKGKSSNTSFDFGEFDRKLAGINIPKAEETIKGKSSFTLFGSDITFSEPKGVESIKGKSSSTLFGFEGKISDPTFTKPKAESTEGKPGSSFFGSERKFSDFTFPETKGVEFMKGKSDSTFFGFERKISDPTFIKPKEEPIEGKPSSTFFGSEGNIPDSTFLEAKTVESIKGKSSSTFFDSEGKSPDFTLSEPEGVESMKEKSSSSPSDSYEVVLDFDNRQDNLGGLILSERLPICLKCYEIYVSKPDIGVLEVGITGKVFVPVFSKEFTSNEACLWNLVSMVDCMSYSVTNHIIPIFFGVEPSDVRFETPLYRQGLDKLRGSVEDKIVDRWTEALIDVSNISGSYIPETVGPDEIDYLVNEVCQIVLRKLRLSLLSKRTYLGEMDQHVEGIIDMLNLEVNDVRRIVILGDEGLGKTTLARAVYDKLSSRFEGCSFLASIDEMGSNYGSNEILQAKLVSDLLEREVEVFKSVDEGRDLISERFCHMKVLIVLDGVCHLSMDHCVGEPNWFGPGSRIIITTTRADRFIRLDHFIYDLSSHRPRLSDDEVFDLFNHHAFPNGHPFPNFHALSREISKAITKSGFYPFDMEIVGSLLYGKSEAEWESMLLHLRQRDGRPFYGRWNMLKMSYDGLTEKQKGIFLDVSCLPDGMDRRIALLLWYNSIHSKSYHDFEVLICSSLVKIDANDGIWMHESIRRFGRSIIALQDRPTNGTGLVDMDTARFFKMVSEHNDDANKGCQRQRGLVWKSEFPNSVEANRVKSLIVLDLSWSKITEKWENWHQIQAPQLRVLNLTGCIDLMVTPNFSFCPDLEILILEHCSQLVEIDPSIKVLQRLAILNLRYCMELSVLPKEIGCLNALKELLMDETSIQEIPASIGHLKKLQVFTAINCSSLTQLPSSTCNLLFITALKLDGAKITELPCSILQRLKLQYLSLRDCRHITNLGSFVGEVERSLKELDISRTSISELPKSISKLKNLRVLKMDFCFIREFPPGFGKLKKLEEVHTSWCKRLENLPHDIGGVESLRILKVGHSRISGLPHSIRLLEHLEILDCTSCNKLQGLPELPSSLTSLHVQSKEFEALPDLRNLVKLKEVTLINDAIIIHRVSSYLSEGIDPFEWLQISTSLKTLTLCLPHTKMLPGFPLFLKKLTLQCTNIEHIPSFPLTLVVISIRSLRLLKELPNVGSLHNLVEMEVACCPKIEKLEGLGRLTALEILTVLDCKIRKLDGLEKLISLRRFTLQDCRSLSILPSLEKLENMLEMKITGCSKLPIIVGLWGLQRLQVLSILNCGIQAIIGLERLSSLRRLTITDCGSLWFVPDTSNLRNLTEKCVLLEDPE